MVLAYVALASTWWRLTSGPAGWRSACREIVRGSKAWNPPKGKSGITHCRECYQNKWKAAATISFCADADSIDFGCSGKFPSTRKLSSNLPPSVFGHLPFCSLWRRKVVRSIFSEEKISRAIKVARVLCNQILSFAFERPHRAPIRLDNRTTCREMCRALCPYWSCPKRENIIKS